MGGGRIRETGGPAPPGRISGHRQPGRRTGPRPSPPARDPAGPSGSLRSVAASIRLKSTQSPQFSPGRDPAAKFRMSAGPAGPGSGDARSRRRWWSRFRGVPRRPRSRRTAGSRPGRTASPRRRKPPSSDRPVRKSCSGIRVPPDLEIKGDKIPQTPAVARQNYCRFFGNLNCGSFGLRIGNRVPEFRSQGIEKNRIADRNPQSAIRNPQWFS